MIAFLARKIERGRGGEVIGRQVALLYRRR